MHIPKQPKHNNENQYGGKAAAAKFPCSRASEQSAKWSFHIFLSLLSVDKTQ
jgi:hypothetical protein